MRRWIDNPSVLDNLNSLTKFPSIPTLHGMGEKGRLTDDLDPAFVACSEEFVATEKVDGTNSRVVVLPDGTFLVGSREEWLWYSGDLVHNRALGIVAAVRTSLNVMSDGECDRIDEVLGRREDLGLLALYLETYGHGIGKNGVQYSKIFTDTVLFDVAWWPGRTWLRQCQDSGQEEIARRRDAGGTPFLSWSSVQAYAERLNLRQVAAREPPRLNEYGHQQIFDYLCGQPRSSACIDDEVVGKPEGVVLRSKAGNPSVDLPEHPPVVRVKLRTEDYLRTLRASK